jgi:hypothetical protein
MRGKGEGGRTVVGFHPELRNIGRMEDWKNVKGAPTGAFITAMGRMKHQAVRELMHVRRACESATDSRACPIFQPSRLPTPAVLGFNCQLDTGHTFWLDPRPLSDAFFNEVGKSRCLRKLRRAASAWRQ